MPKKNKKSSEKRNSADSKLFMARLESNVFPVARTKNKGNNFSVSLAEKSLENFGKNNYTTSAIIREK